MSKNMIRAGQSSMIYDFFMYGGKHRAGAKKCAAEESVLRLVKHLPKNNMIGWLFFDNWISTIDQSSLHGNTHDCNFQVK